MPAKGSERLVTREDAQTPEVAVKVRSVSVEFSTPGGSPLTVLSRLSLEVPRGQLLAIVGASGSGKTTLLNLVAGLIKPNSGEIVVLDKSPRVGRPEVGYMFARDSLLPWRTARQNVELALELRGLRRTPRRQRAAELLDRVHLSPAADKYPAQLSHGMRQRVALARTWATGPELLLMDEPFASLDALTRMSVRDSFLRIWDDGLKRKTVLFVTHDLTEALVLADRVVLIAGGGIQMDVPLPYRRPRVLRDIMLLQDYYELYDALERALKPTEMGAEQAPGHGANRLEGFGERVRRSSDDASR